MRETLIFVDHPAADVVRDAGAFFRGRGLTITQESTLSLAITGSGSVGGDEPDAVAIAAVPVQLRPEWTRLWITDRGEGRAQAAARAYATGLQARSAELQRAVQALEVEIYSEQRWPAHEAQLRANLARQQLDPAAVEVRIAAFKRRWRALGRKAAQSRE